MARTHTISTERNGPALLRCALDRFCVYGGQKGYKVEGVCAVGREKVLWTMQQEAQAQLHPIIHRVWMCMEDDMGVRGGHVGECVGGVWRMTWV